MEKDVFGRPFFINLSSAKFTRRKAWESALPTISKDSLFGTKECVYIFVIILVFPTYLLLYPVKMNFVKLTLFRWNEFVIERGERFE